MNVFTSASSKLTLASVAMFASMGAQALTLSGSPAAVYLETSPGTLTSVTVNQANVDSALSGAGNVELGKFGSSPVTTLSGDIGGVDVTLRSLTRNDWTYNGNALATAYINGAANSIGTSLTNGQLTQALTTFLSVDLDPGTGTRYAWQFVSDPNISDVGLSGGNVVAGLDGLLDGTAFLNSIFGAFGVTAPDDSTASEVLRADYNGTTKYLFGFDAVATNYATADGSYSGRFSVGTGLDAGLIVPDAPIPEPASLALFGLGFAGMGLMRRRRNA